MDIVRDMSKGRDLGTWEIGTSSGRPAGTLDNVPGRESGLGTKFELEKNFCSTIPYIGLSRLSPGPGPWHGNCPRYGQKPRLGTWARFRPAGPDIGQSPGLDKMPWPRHLPWAGKPGPGTFVPAWILTLLQD